VPISPIPQSQDSRSFGDDEVTFRASPDQERELSAVLDQVADAFSGRDDTGLEFTPVRTAAARERARDIEQDRLREDVLNRLSAGGAGMTGAQMGKSVAGAALGAAALYGLTQLLMKRASDKKSARKNGDKRVPIVSRKPIAKFGGKRGFKKGGVIKKKVVKKVAHKKEGKH
tara:strand:+ start:493 stop:1008 length:516 start_codon:yes stop_codon:yes gene_type:complete